MRKKPLRTVAKTRGVPDLEVRPAVKLATSLGPARLPGLR